MLSYRNRLVKTWAASVDAVSFVDFEAMARDSHRPPRAKGDMHWMCWLRWLSGEVRECECVLEQIHIYITSFCTTSTAWRIQRALHLVCWMSWHVAEPSSNRKVARVTTACVC